MRTMHWVGLFAAILLVIACFMPWVTIRNLGEVSGWKAPKGFGKPAGFHFFFLILFLSTFFINNISAKYIAILAGVLNIAWAFRNYTFTFCAAGECPEKHTGIYLILLSSLLLLIAALFAPVKLKPAA